MDDETVCCGQGGTWATAGSPLVLACALCPHGPRYWRRADNRADGQPYRAVTIDESYAALDRPDAARSRRA